jgi:MinD superfamily P-loop ATPase
MIISIASGKGGTGKTTVAVNLALSLEEEVNFLDCDVEEPNAHIFLKSEIEKIEPVSIPVPRVDKSKCNFCGKCAEICAYNAIAVVKGIVLIFPHLCHGCGGCRLLCPEGAIEEVDRNIGVIEYGNAGKIKFVQGKLNIGEAMAIPVIRKVKKIIRNEHLTIIDAPPGTSCPMIEAVKNSDFCILVTEPTPFGFNDLLLAVETLKKLKIPFGVIINRADIGDKKVEDYCEKEKIPVLMRIPFKKEIAIAYSNGEPIIKVLPEYKMDFKNFFNKIKKEVEK